VRANQCVLPGHFTAIFSIVFALQHLFVLSGVLKSRKEVLEDIMEGQSLRVSELSTCMCDCVHMRRSIDVSFLRLLTYKGQARTSEEHYLGKFLGALAVSCCLFG